MLNNHLKSCLFASILLLQGCANPIHSVVASEPLSVNMSNQAASSVLPQATSDESNEFMGNPIIGTQWEWESIGGHIFFMYLSSQELINKKPDEFFGGAFLKLGNISSHGLTAPLIIFSLEKHNLHNLKSCDYFEKNDTNCTIMMQWDKDDNKVYRVPVRIKIGENFPIHGLYLPDDPFWDLIRDSHTMEIWIWDDDENEVAHYTFNTAGFDDKYLFDHPIFKKLKKWNNKPALR